MDVWEGYGLWWDSSDSDFQISGLSDCIDRCRTQKEKFMGEDNEFIPNQLKLKCLEYESTVWLNLSFSVWKRGQADEFVGAIIFYTNSNMRVNEIVQVVSEWVRRKEH